MPPRARLRTRALEELAAQLRFAPREALDRHIAAAERLASELDPAGAYPEDWFVFRLTGYRPDIDEPASLVGEALLGDLSALVERLTIAAHRTPEDAGPGALDIEGLCARWNVGRRTIERYRRRGLIAHRVVGDSGVQRLLFPVGNVEAFETREGERVRAAGAFSRIEPGLEARLARRAARYRSSLGLSLNEAAERLALRFDRSHEGVRQALRRRDDEARAQGEPVIFDDPRPPTRHERAVWTRALARGIEPSAIAQRTGRPRQGVLRAVLAERADRLRALDLRGPSLPTFARDDAGEVLLGSDAVRSGPFVPGTATLGQLLDAVSQRRTVPAPVEAARTIAYHYLRFDAARIIGGLDPAAPSAREIDRAETALRWAARLKAALVHPLLRLILDTFEGEGVRPQSLGTRGLRELLVGGVAVLAEAVDRFDPSRGGRLAAPSSIALGRHATQWARSRPTATPRDGRAARGLRADAPAPDWTRLLAPGQAWLEPDPRLAGALPGLGERRRLVLERRFALDGGPPEDLDALAERLGTTRTHAAVFEREAIRAGLARARHG